MISTCGKCLIVHTARRPGISGFAEKIRQVSVEYGQASALFSAPPSAVKGSCGNSRYFCSCKSTYSGFTGTKT
jgi:hypothetical protein